MKLVTQQNIQTHTHNSLALPLARIQLSGRSELSSSACAARPSAHQADCSFRFAGSLCSASRPVWRSKQTPRDKSTSSLPALNAPASQPDKHLLCTGQIGTHTHCRRPLETRWLANLGRLGGAHFRPGELFERERGSPIDRLGCDLRVCVCLLLVANLAPEPM